MDCAVEEGGGCLGEGEGSVEFDGGDRGVSAEDLNLGGGSGDSVAMESGDGEGDYV